MPLNLGNDGFLTEVENLLNPRRLRRQGAKISNHWKWSRGKEQKRFNEIILATTLP